VLIDTRTGTSQVFGPRLGHLLANLRASGDSAEQVEEIYVTHMHTDYIGGLMRDGQPAFPKATIRADGHEAGRYLSKAEMDAAPADERENFESAMAIFKPYLASGKFKPFDGETQLIPGVRAMPAAGHTPGHESRRLSGVSNVRFSRGSMAGVGRYVQLYIEQRIFSSASRRTMSTMATGADRRGGELKIACTKPLHSRWGYGN